MNCPIPNLSWWIRTVWTGDSLIEKSIETSKITLKDIEMRKTKLFDAVAKIVKEWKLQAENHQREERVKAEAALKEKKRTQRIAAEQYENDIVLQEEQMAEWKLKRMNKTPKKMDPK
jgi:hypothetical protein